MSEKKRPSSLIRPTGVVVGVVAVLAFYLSYTGLHALALHVGIEGREAAIYPLIVDLVIVVAYAGTIMLGKSRWYAWAVLLAYIALSVVGNSLSEGQFELGHAAVRAVPPISLAVALHLALLVWRAEPAEETRPKTKGSKGGKVDVDPPSTPTSTPPNRPARSNVSQLRRPSESGSSGRNTPLERHQRWAATLPDDLRTALASGADAPTLFRMMTERGYLKDRQSRRRASQRWVEKRDNVFAVPAEEVTA